MTIKESIILKAPHIVENPTRPVEQKRDASHRSDLEVFSFFLFFFLGGGGGGGLK